MIVHHLRPSLLQVYVRNPDVPTGAIRLRRLAAVSGSTRTALAFALTGLTPATGAHRLRPPSPAESQPARKARLFGIIRDDDARGMSIRQIAGRRRVHRRMVRQALAEPAGPPPRKRGTRPAPAIDPIQDVLDKLAGEPLTVWEIWTTVTDQHDSDASSATIREGRSAVPAPELRRWTTPAANADGEERSTAAGAVSAASWLSVLTPCWPVRAGRSLRSCIRCSWHSPRSPTPPPW